MSRPHHDQVAQLATYLLEAAHASGQWRLDHPGAEAAERARIAYSTAQVYLGTIEDLRPERDGGRRRPGAES